MKQVTDEEVAARKEAAVEHAAGGSGAAAAAEGGVFLLEELAGKPVLQKVEGNKIQENDHEGKNMLKRSIIPIASQVQTIELKGAAAKVRVHSAGTRRFLWTWKTTRGAIEGDYFRIVRLERKKDLRVVAKNKVESAGTQSQTEKFLHSRAEKFSGDWWKLIPLEDLTPGEYAIVISAPGDDGNGVVWDFGVDK